MKQALFFLFVLGTLTVKAQQKAPAYELLKPYFSANKAQVIVAGLSNDSLFQSVLFRLESDKKKSDKPNLIPCLVLPFNDSLYYIHQRTISFNKTFKEVWDDTVLIHYYGYQSYPVVRSRYSDVLKEPDYDRTHQEKPADIEPDINVWDETNLTNIDFILPDMVQLTSYYDGYTGGAHPNHNSFTYITSAEALVRSGLDSEGQFVIQEAESTLLQKLKPANLDSVERVLYFKGAAHCFDDYYDTDTSCLHFDVTKYSRYKIGDMDTAEYQVNLYNLNAILSRVPNGYDVIVEAYADAPYVVSGDYSLTASCRQGRLPITFYPYSHATLTLPILKTIDKDVVDFYVVEDNSAMMLVRETSGGVQLRCIYNEGKDFLDMPIRGDMRVIQFQVLRDAVAQRLVNETGLAK